MVDVDCDGFRRGGRRDIELEIESFLRTLNRGNSARLNGSELTDGKTNGVMEWKVGRFRLRNDGLHQEERRVEKGEERSKKLILKRSRRWMYASVFI